MAETTIITPVLTWADRIRPHLVAAVEHIVTAGRELIEAKEHLEHGQFLDLVGTLGLKPRTAQKFMSIARNEILANASPETHLPTSWTTLYELSRMPDEELERALASGAVTADMSRKDALQLAAKIRTSPPLIQPEQVEQMTEDEAAALSIQIREMQYEVGALAIGCIRAGMDASTIAELFGAVDVDPWAWERLGFETHMDWVLGCVDIVNRVPNPDTSLPWEEQMHPVGISLVDPASGQQVGNLRVHPILDAIPLLAEDVHMLTESVERDGVLNPVKVTKAGVLLDGRLRLLACHRLGIVCPLDVVEVEDEGAYVWSLNMVRGHYTEDQRAAFLAGLA